MATDYRKLCLELFGTDNEEKLREIAAKKVAVIKSGRKKKFSSKDIADMADLHSHGVSVNELARQYGTTRQMISKCLNRKPDPGYTMRMTYMYGQTPCTDIDVNFMDRKIAVQNYTDDPLHRAFGLTAAPTWADFEDFLQYRSFPATRGNVKSLLRDLNITDYDPLQIIEKTHGKIADDNMWVKVRYYGC